MAPSPASLAERIKRLSPGDRLRLAAAVLDGGDPTLALSIVEMIANELRVVQQVKTAQP